MILLDVGDDFFPGTGQEWAQDTVFHWTDTGETLDSRSATYINKEGLKEGTYQFLVEIDGKIYNTGRYGKINE